MDNEYNENQQPVFRAADGEVPTLETIIPVIQETIQIDKETIETAKIQISKKVKEHQEEVAIPLITEQYEVVHVPVHETVATLPPAVRQEGDTTIVSVVKEVLVIEKRYEIIEELHITKRTTEHIEKQNVMLLTEEVSVVRTPLQGEGVNI